MSDTPAGLLDDGFLAALARRADADAFVARQRTLATLAIGFRDSGSGHAATIAVTPDAIEARDGGRAPFTFVGDAAALQALAGGFPFNRLVRQHRLTIEGDLRACVQNWLLIHAILRLCASPDR